MAKERLRDAPFGRCRQIDTRAKRHSRSAHDHHAHLAALGQAIRNRVQVARQLLVGADKRLRSIQCDRSNRAADSGMDRVEAHGHYDTGCLARRSPSR
jgi:hypothetical protein